MWLWIMLCYAEPVVVNQYVLFWGSGCESWCIILNQWLWIMFCYSEPVDLNHGELCWASGCESWWAIIEFNIRLYDKNSESDFFFSSTKIRIFFSATLGIKLNARSLTRLREVGGFLVALLAPKIKLNAAT